MDEEHRKNQQDEDGPGPEDINPSLDFDDLDHHDSSDEEGQAEAQQPNKVADGN